MVEVYNIFPDFIDVTLLPVSLNFQIEQYAPSRPVARRDLIKGISIYEKRFIKTMEENSLVSYSPSCSPFDGRLWKG